MKQERPDQFAAENSGKSILGSHLNSVQCGRSHGGLAAVGGGASSPGLSGARLDAAGDAHPATERP